MGGRPRPCLLPPQRRAADPASGQDLLPLRSPQDFVGRHFEPNPLILLTHLTGESSNRIFDLLGQWNDALADIYSDDGV
jgi:hypothetical protein